MPIQWPIAAIAGNLLGGMVAAEACEFAVEFGLVPYGLLGMGLCSLFLGFAHGSLLSAVGIFWLGFSASLCLVPLEMRLNPARKGLILPTALLANVAGAIALSLFVSRFHNPQGPILIALGLALLPAAAFAAGQAPDRTIRFFLWCWMSALFRVRVTGRHNIPPTGAALMVSNHISYADSVLVGQCTPRIPRFLMWRPIYNAPGIHVFFKLLHAIPINAESPKGTIQALRAARAVMEAGELVAIFPEGSITRTGQTEPFQRGFERIIDGLDVPVIPMYVSGLWGHPLSLKGGKLFGTWEKLFRPVVDIAVGSPIFGSISPSELREAVLRLAPANSRVEDRQLVSSDR